MVEDDKNDEFEVDLFDRKMKKLTDEDISKIEVKRETYIEGKLIERAEREEMRKEGKTKEDIEKEIRERLIRRMRKEAKEERERIEKKIGEIEEEEGVKGIEIESKDGIRPDKFESRKGKWDREPPLEDSAGVCMYEEKEVDLDIDPDTGVFKAAYVQGVKLNL